MADYTSYTRTNYFRVTDPNAVTKLVMSAMQESNMNSEFCISDDHDNAYLAFGGEGYLYPECTESLFPALQNYLVDNDAIIITEVGHENLRYLVSMATIITKNAIDVVDIHGVAIDKARKLLNDPTFITDDDY